MTPTPLTDEQIVRTLAEFMGKRVIVLECCRPIYDTRMGRWWYAPSDLKKGDPDRVLLEQVEGTEPRRGIFEHLPRYLTSYDALAPVWRKAWDKGNLADKALENLGLGSGEEYPLLLFPNFDPKDHARALAAAIQGARK